MPAEELAFIFINHGLKQFNRPIDQSVILTFRDLPLVGCEIRLDPIDGALATTGNQRFLALLAVHARKQETTELR
jgi:hypothetical protein